MQSEFSLPLVPELIGRDDVLHRRHPRVEEVERPWYVHNNSVITLGYSMPIAITFLRAKPCNGKSCTPQFLLLVVLIKIVYCYNDNQGPLDITPRSCNTLLKAS